MHGRAANRAERLWMEKARQLGCIVCIRERKIAPWSTPGEYVAIHHMAGKTKPGAHLLTLPLCATHHQTGKDARHANKARFEAKFGTEAELLEYARALVASRE